MSRTVLACCLAVVVAASGAAGESPTLRVDNDGVLIVAGGFGDVRLGWPTVAMADGNVVKPLSVKVVDGVGTVDFADGTVATVRVQGAEARIVFARVPAGADGVRFESYLNSTMRRGGSWAVDAAGAAFPAGKPEKPFLFQGGADRMTLTDVAGRSVAVQLPAYSWLQLQDNLEWGWDIFCFWFKAPLNDGARECVISVSGDLTSHRTEPLVDEFGQTMLRDFPGKVHSLDELKADIAGDAAYYGSFSGGSKLDAFGGIAGTRERFALTATGFFHIERPKGRWLLVDPDGNAFFHLGICCMGPSGDHTYIKGREAEFAWLPPFDGEFRPAWHEPDFRAHDNFSFFNANIIRKTGAWNPEARWGEMIDRVRAVGFNSSGAFSGQADAGRTKRWSWTPFLPLGTWSLGYGIPGVRGVFDPFHPEVAARVRALFEKDVAPMRDDPLVIGWFLENEQAFEDLPRVIPVLDGKQACKRELVARLAKAYHDDIAAFNRAWALDAADFAALNDRALAVTTDTARADVHRFVGDLLEAYYGLIRSEFDRVDPNHMLIGNRWQPGTANDEQLVRTAAKHLDVISLNYYSYGIDEAFIDRIWTWSGEKPQFWSEFHFGCTAESGLAGRMDLPTQAARGSAYRHYVEHAAASGKVLGIEWFQLTDQPVSGRWFEGIHGEAYAIGMFTVTDRPYRDLLAAMAATNRGALAKVWLDGGKPFVFDDPRFRARAAGLVTEATHAPGAMTIDGAGTDWPAFPPVRIGGDHVVLGTAAEGFEASVRLCYDDTALYVLAEIGDATPMTNEREGSGLWDGDGLEVFIGPDATSEGALRADDRQVLLAATPSGGAAHMVHAEGAKPAIAVRRADGRKGVVIEAALTWSDLGITAKPGSTVRFNLAIDDGQKGAGRSAQLVWCGGERASSDRSGWGILRLAP